MGHRSIAGFLAFVLGAGAPAAALAADAAAAEGVGRRIVCRSIPDPSMSGVCVIEGLREDMPPEVMQERLQQALNLETADLEQLIVTPPTAEAHYVNAVVDADHPEVLGYLGDDTAAALMGGASSFAYVGLLGLAGAGLGIGLALGIDGDGDDDGPVLSPVQ